MDSKKILIFIALILVIFLFFPFPIYYERIGSEVVKGSYDKEKICEGNSYAEECIRFEIYSTTYENRLISHSKEGPPFRISIYSEHDANRIQKGKILSLSVEDYATGESIINYPIESFIKGYWYHGGVISTWSESYEFSSDIGKEGSFCITMIMLENNIETTYRQCIRLFEDNGHIRITIPQYIIASLYR